MESKNISTPLLELIERPVLCVKNGIITELNRAAAQMQIVRDTPIRALLPQDHQAYEQFESGQLFLNLSVCQIPCGATVIRSQDMDYFILDQQEDTDRLQAMALAAQQLRMPLSNVMTIVDQFLANRHLEASCDLRTQAGKINQGLFQLLRILSNMADAIRYADPEPVRMENCNLTAFIDEVFQKARVLIQDTGVKLRYCGLSQPIFGLASCEHLERGIYNLISNAIKFSPKGGKVEAKLIQSGTFLSLSIQDSGSGIPPQIQPTLFARYRRQPGIEDGRYGIGLGMTMVRSAATIHGGTVLIDHPAQGGTRVTLTISIREPEPGTTLRTPIRSICDYAGGWDHGLTELAELLSSETYEG